MTNTTADDGSELLDLRAIGRTIRRFALPIAIASVIALALTAAVYWHASPSYVATAELQHGLTPKVEDRFLGVVAIDGLPAESWPGILNSLDLMPLSYRWSSRFIFLDAEEARQKLERTRKKWQQKVRPFFDQLFQTQSRSVDQDAMTMVAETEDAIAQASSQLVAYGYYTPVIVMFDSNREALQEKAEADGLRIPLGSRRSR